MGNESRPVPRDREGGAAREGARRPRRLDHRHPPRPVAHACRRAEARLGRAARAREGEPPRGLVGRTMLGLHPRARPAVQRAPRSGVRLDRRYALDAAGRRPIRPLGRYGQGRVRHPHGQVRGRPGDRLVSSGFVLWFTGLSAAGKTTVGSLVARELEARGRTVEVLDGDVVRTHLSKGLGFSKDDRDANILRIGWVASRLARAGAAVVVSAISPYEEARRSARATVEEQAPFVEIHVATPLEVCAERDPKGLYKRAMAGEIEHFTGVDAPYEVPSNPELRLHTGGQAPAESAALVLARLEELELIESKVTA